MKLPRDLEHAIDYAYNSVLQDSQHALRPSYRRGIYDLLDPRAWGMLSILTVRKFLFLWNRTFLEDHRPTRLLEIAEEVVRGTVSVKGAEEIATTEGISMGDLNPDSPDLAMIRLLQENPVPAYLLLAARTALREAQGYSGFDNMILSLDDTDADIDPGSSDTAKWVVTAYAGGVWQSESDSAKRRQFWEWWLRVAIPEAWSLVNGDPA